jgi:Zonular occludens toxin (Zot)
MSVSCVYGLPGAGKSHFSLFYGLSLCEKFGKTLVTNYLLDLDKISHYCYLMGYFDFLNRLGKEGIVYISADTHAGDFLSVRNSVIVLDEAGIYFPARGFKDTPKKLLADLCQVRHDASMLLCIAQAEKQIDIQIRNLSWEVFQCRGLSVYDKKLNNQKLIFKNIYRFDKDRYEVYMNDPKIRKNPLKSRLCSNKTWQGPLTCADLYLFSCFDSFGRLDQNQAHDDDYDRVLALSTGKQYYFNWGKYDDFLSSFADNTDCIHAKPKLFNIIAFLFTRLPANFLDRVLIWEKSLSSFRGFTSSEVFIIKVIYGFLIGVPFLSILSAPTIQSIIFFAAFINLYLFTSRLLGF